MADRLEKFENKKTDWKGLWLDAERGVCVSESINFSELRKFKGVAKILVIKNKFYKEGTRRPIYVFSIQDAKAEISKTIDIVDTTKPEYAKQDENGVWRTNLGERLYTKEEVQYCINRAAEDGERGYGYGENIVDDYL